MQTDDSSERLFPLVYVIGDSISIQYGPYLEQALAGMFRYDRKSGEAEAFLNLDVPLGANAGDSARVLDFLRASLETGNFHPDILLMNCGLHDIKRTPQTGAIQVPLELYEANLRQIAELCRNAMLRLVWVRSTPVVDQVHNSRLSQFHRFAADLLAYNDRADKIMKSAGIPTIDLFTFTRRLGQDADLFCDHVHFRDEIRQKQGCFLAGRLAEFARLSQLVDNKSGEAA